VLGLNVFFPGNTCTILDVKIRLELPQHWLCNLLQVLFRKIKRKVKVENSTQKSRVLQYKSFKSVGLDAFFLENTCMMLNLKVCLESPKHRLFNLLKAFFLNGGFQSKKGRKVNETVQYIFCKKENRYWLVEAKYV
jgi:hypothetical protein